MYADVSMSDATIGRGINASVGIENRRGIQGLTYSYLNPTRWVAHKSSTSIFFFGGNKNLRALLAKVFEQENNRSGVRGGRQFGSVYMAMDVPPRMTRLYLLTPTHSWEPY